MNSKKVWISGVIIAALLVAGFLFRNNLLALTGSSQADAQADTTPQAEQPIAIRPAADVAQVSAAGNIALASEQTVVFRVEGIVTDVAVEVGDEVAAGDLLASLEPDDLARAVQQAELNVSISQAELDALLEPASPEEIAAAEANLVAAQEELADLQAGSSASELAAAKASLAAAKAQYQELLDGPSQAELTQLSVELHKAGITLKEAQEAYNEIAYSDTVGRSSQAMDLQTATIEYDAAKAAYEIATEPASEAELQEALSAIKSAQHEVEQLAPTRADLAAAQAQVAGAEAELSDLLAGADKAELEQARLNLAQAELDLDEAKANLARAQLRAPLAGTILTLDIAVGQQLSAGTSALTLADLSALELTVNVAEVDISKVQQGQPAQIALDALPDRTLSGAVRQIAPASESDSGVVNYAVTIRLDGDNLEGVRPGMTAVTTLLDPSKEQQWLVPTSAIREFEGKQTVRVVRGDSEVRVEVTTGATQGEWTMVSSPELQAGDKVMGRVASYVDEEQESSSNRPPGFGPPPR
jgi:HlyD family secretion protein